MVQSIFYQLFAVTILLSLAACGGGSHREGPALETTVNRRPAATAAKETDPRQARLSPVIDKASLPAAVQAGTTPTVTLSPAAERFQIDQRSRSREEALQNVALVLHWAELRDEALVLRLAFQNTSDQGFLVSGGSNARRSELVDANGHVYKPTEVGDNLRYGLDPRGGFTPGAANVGSLSFPRPTGPPPYTLHYPAYGPITFQLDGPVSQAAVAPTEGTYPVETMLHSTDPGLARIELQVHSLQITTDTLIFEVAFANTSRRGYNLLTGPGGDDARLLDAEGAAHEPIAVSPSLKLTIDPKGGWLPNEAHAGALIFSRPAALSKLRLTFPSYNALTLDLDESGIAGAQATSPSGRAPQPTPTPSGEERLIVELEAVLAQQAEALLAGDEAAYLATFGPDLHAEQRQLLARIPDVPLNSYNLHLDPSAVFQEGEELKGVAVEVSYTLEGISPVNIFRHDLSYTFTRTAGAWQVTAIDLGRNPPFWRTGDLVVRQTDHFLLFARPELPEKLPDLARMTGTAYETLAARGLPVEPRYVTYFTADQEDFATVTGYASSRVLGVAQSRYIFQDNNLAVSSYAFFINGQVFEQQQTASSDALQTTITHELVHLMLAPMTRPFTPPWLSEGMAVYFTEETGSQERTELLLENGLDKIDLQKLTRAGSLGEHDFLGRQTRYEYIFSGETIAYLVERYGEEAVLDFYASYTQVPGAQVRDQMPRFGNPFLAQAAFANLREEATNEGLQAFFGLSLAELEAEVKDAVQQ